METYKFERHGFKPYSVVVVHGGPGAPGSVAPVAIELSNEYGVLEPFQTADSVDGQIEELKAVIKNHGNPPVTLIGHSWGAFLCWMVASGHPELVKKLILVGSGVFEKQYAEKITATRMNRLNDKDRREVEAYIQQFNDPNENLTDRDFSRLGAILTRADIYCPMDTVLPNLKARIDIYVKVWPEAEKLRNSGRLLKMSTKIQCPVVAIHGDYDPHPAEGVENLLTKAVKEFKFILLNKCGHYPWLEKYTRDEFFTILKQEIK